MTVIVLLMLHGSVWHHRCSLRITLFFFIHYALSIRNGRIGWGWSENFLKRTVCRERYSTGTIFCSELSCLKWVVLKPAVFIYFLFILCSLFHFETISTPGETTFSAWPVWLKMCWLKFQISFCTTWEPEASNPARHLLILQNHLQFCPTIQNHYKHWSENDHDNHDEVTTSVLYCFT